MQLLFIYCLKLSISLAVVSLFYQLVLRRLTFYKWNRYFLMGYSCLCFLISFIDISPLMEHSSWRASQVTTWIPVVHHVQIVKSSQDGLSLMTLGDMVSGVLVLGIVIMFARLLLQLLSLRRLRRTARVIEGDGPTVYEVRDSIIPFSFGASIYVNKSLHTETELEEIIRHEFVHVRQRHSIDIMWSEIICILNWYNPFAWLLKFSIRQNLEFIADSEVLQNGMDKKEYQYLLLKVMGNSQFSIVQNFNFSSLKKRIAMMNKSKSAALSVVRFLFILPLIVVLLLAFRSIKTIRQQSRRGNTTQTLATADTIPKSSVSPRKSVTKEKSVSTVSDNFEISDGKAIVHLQDGGTEEFDLNNNAQRESFKKKYPDVYAKMIGVDNDLPAVKSVIVAATAGVPTTAESPVKINSVVKAISSTTIQSTVDCNVNAAINSNMSTVVNATSNVNAVPVTTNVDGRAVAVAVPLAGSAASSVIADENVNIITGDEEALFTITKNTTRQQLDQLENQMKEKGFSLNFKDVKYDKDGRLVSINGTVGSKDATGKFAAATFSKIIVYVINDGDHTYFRIDEQRAVKRVI